MSLHIADIDLIDDEGMHHVPDPLQAALAEEILDWFVKLRPQYVPGRVTIPKKSLPHFYRAAEICSQRGQTPALYVRQQLDGMAVVGTFWPTAIANENIAEEAGTADAANIYSVLRYKAQLDLFHSRVRLYGPILAIRDKGNPFTPLLRCVLAHEYGLTEVVDDYRDAALVELDSIPMATQVFENRIDFLYDEAVASGESRR